MLDFCYNNNSTDEMEVQRKDEKSCKVRELDWGRILLPSTQKWLLIACLWPPSLTHKSGSWSITAIFNGLLASTWTAGPYRRSKAAKQQYCKIIGYERTFWAPKAVTLEKQVYLVLGNALISLTNMKFSRKLKPWVFDCKISFSTTLKVIIITPQLFLE